LRNLRELGEKDIILLRSHHSTLDVEEIAGVPVETDLEAALAHQPDAVVIANPTALHMDVAVPAALAGSHLFLEKPISHSMEGVEDLHSALTRSGARALVGFQYHFHPGLQKVHELLQIGAIGRPLSARVHWGEYLPDFHPWEDYRKGYAARSDLGGGVVFTLSHPFDYLRWLLGEIEGVWAFTSNSGGLEIAVEDNAEIGLRFTSGAIGSVHLDFTRRVTSHTLEITGTLGVISWSNSTGATRIFRASTDAWESFLPPVGFERNDLFLAEMRHFIQVSSGAAEPVCTLEDGIRILGLTLAVHESARTGRMIDV
jgi:predicted dehydrogenase